MASKGGLPQESETNELIKANEQQKSFGGFNYDPPASHTSSGHIFLKLCEFSARFCGHTVFNCEPGNG
jgi:hypothetical protein